MQLGLNTRGDPMRQTLAAALLLFGVAAPLRAQDTLFFVPSDRIAVREMRRVPAIELAPRVHVRTVVGTTGSFSLADFDSGGAAVLHHHTREQADVGITGVLDMTLGTRAEPLGPGRGVIVPPNVAHSIANARGGTMTVIEFHTVPRPDLVPPRPAMTFPSSPVPASVPEGRELVKQLDGSGGPANASPTIIGETCIMRWRRLTRGAPAVDVHPDSTGAELFAYVVRGEVELTSASSVRRVGAGNLIVIPAGLRHVRLRSVGDGDVGLVEFIAARR
jgi:mannose-6-phosphate isomerase-like protein (cupin superfamily)